MTNTHQSILLRSAQPRWPTLQWLLRTALFYLAGAAFAGLAFLVYAAFVAHPTATLTVITGALSLIAGFISFYAATTVKLSEHLLAERHELLRKLDAEGTSWRKIEEELDEIKKLASHHRRIFKHEDVLFHDLEKQYSELLPRLGRDYVRFWLLSKLMRLTVMAAPSFLIHPLSHRVHQRSERQD